MMMSDPNMFMAVAMIKSLAVRKSPSSSNPIHFKYSKWWKLSQKKLMRHQVLLVEVARVHQIIIAEKRLVRRTQPQQPIRRQRS
jgi:hypothetical protein